MIIYALIGKSGSGKSHRAQQVSKDYSIEFIIDDGLLINGTRVVAGISAKKENTRIAAVKRALFLDTGHRVQVLKAIGEFIPSSILILGTSDNMINRITENLNLPSASKKIYIEDIATQREIEIATRTRKEQGKHVIPVPTFSIKKDFSGYFIASVKNFTKKGRSLDNDEIEKTVVRPTFSYLGRYTIANNVIKAMVSYAGEKVDGVFKIIKVNIENRSSGLKIDIEISVSFGYIIPGIVNNLREYIKSELEYMTAFNILEINVSVRSLNIDNYNR